MRSATLVEIGAGNGIEVPPGVSHGPFRFDGFRAFADQNSRVRDCLRTPEDFRRIAVEFCADEAADGTRYAEVTFTAAAHGERLGDLAMPLAAVMEGLAEGQREHGITVRVLLDHSRRQSVARLRRTVELAVRFADQGVIGIGVAGDETYPLAPFAPVLRAAREAGLRLTHHAGESAGAASVLEAVVVGGAERVGHGFRVLEDPEVVALLRERRVPVEVCVSSNVALGLVPSVAEHPLPRLLAAGLVVSLNTDVPNVTGRSLSREYAAVRSGLGWDDVAVARVARASVESSFAPDGVRAELSAGVDRWLGVAAGA